MSPGTYIAANWKLNKSRSQAAVWMRELSKRIGQEWAGLEEDTTERLKSHHIQLFPSVTNIEPVSERARVSGVELGAQRVSPYREGSYTGEVSAPQVRELGVSWTLVGHSERRHVFGEDLESVRKQLEVALDSGLKVMLCVGEKLDQRESGRTADVLEEQVSSALENAGEEQASELAVAYEPVWAIGTGESADPGDAADGAGLIKDLTADLLGTEVPVLYGGSVNPDNVISFLTRPELDGALVGGASLEVDSFWELIKLSAAVHLRRSREAE